MDRKWRTNREAIDTVQSYQDFESQLPKRDAEYTLADTADLYAVYTVLHIERKESQLRWSTQGSFYYFIAVQNLQQEGVAEQPAAPEGDEDLPQATAAAPSQAFARAPPPTQQEQQQQQQEGQRQHRRQQALSTAEAVQRRQSAQLGTRTQILVPVSSAYDHLTPELLQRLFSINLKGVQAQQLILALVDGTGVVSRTCLYNYIQAPLEGPGTANLELLDD